MATLMSLLLDDQVKYSTIFGDNLMFLKRHIDKLLDESKRYKVITVLGDSVSDVSLYDNKNDATCDCDNVDKGVIKYLICDDESTVIKYTCDSITETHIHIDERLSRLSTTNIYNLYGKCIVCKHWKAFTISKNMDGLCDISKQITMGTHNCDVVLLESQSASKKFAFDESIFE